jgi:hypothetical protein
MAITGAGFTYFCVASVVALLAAVGALWFKGALDQGRLYRVLAALHGIDVVTMHEQLVQEEMEQDAEQPSYEQRFEQMTITSLDFDLRESAIENAWLEMDNLRTQLEVDTARFEEIKDAYAAKLQQFADEEEANSLMELQRTLEAIKPVQAKEQIIKMLDDDAMEDVVMILKNMPIDKRKKIIGEFKEGPDIEVLHEILTNIRLGEPTATQTRETQEKLNDFAGAQ